MILLSYFFLLVIKILLTHKQIQELISTTVSQSIHSFFEGKEVNVTHMLDHIFPRERKIRSLIGGLETSMGTRVWKGLSFNT